MQTAERWRLWEHRTGIAAAAKVLTRQQREALLRSFTRSNHDDDSFDLILGDHVDLFSDWLRHQTDEYLKLRPLDRDVGPRWEQMAIMALELGVAPEEVAEHCTPHHWGGFGPMSQHFLNRLPAYEKLAQHQDARLRLAGERGLRWVKSMAERELARERREAIYGH